MTLYVLSISQDSEMTLFVHIVKILRWPCKFLVKIPKWPCIFSVKIPKRPPCMSIVPKWTLYVLIQDSEMTLYVLIQDSEMTLYVRSPEMTLYVHSQDSEMTLYVLSQDSKTTGKWTCSFSPDHQIFYHSDLWLQHPKNLYCRINACSDRMWICVATSLPGQTWDNSQVWRRQMEAAKCWVESEHECWGRCETLDIPERISTKWFETYGSMLGDYGSCSTTNLDLKWLSETHQQSPSGSKLGEETSRQCSGGPKSEPSAKMLY